MKKILSFLASRTFIVSALLVLQAAILVGTIWKLSENYAYVYLGFVLLSVIMVVYIVNKDIDPSVKLPWIIAIMLLPVFGGLFYVFFGRTHLSRKARQHLNKTKGYASCYQPNQQIIDDIKKTEPHKALQMQYVQNQTGQTVFENTKVTYCSPGEVKLEHMLRELKRAEKFIFLEYFILQEGKMWDAILDILTQKVQEGLDVRVMYDDFGCYFLLPTGYHKKLEALGIKTQVFNPYRPMLSPLLQNRDHRKILVIDGKVGFTGGINLADEYINAYEKYGYWKDASVMLEGEGVWGLTLMFLEMWNSSHQQDKDYMQFKAQYLCPSDGLVQPYGDSPLDGELVGESIYLNMINNAVEYLYIETPYFVVDNEIMSSLRRAAKRGVDVRVVTPYKWDKWYVHLVTKAHYTALIQAGIKVYEYTPGFIHSKVFVCDDCMATVGTVNMDYRSFRHHFECGAIMYGGGIIADIKRDFEEILSESQEITMEECKKVKLLTRYVRGILRIFAPLL